MLARRRGEAGTIQQLEDDRVHKIGIGLAASLTDGSDFNSIPASSRDLPDPLVGDGSELLFFGLLERRVLRSRGLARPA